MVSMLEILNLPFNRILVLVVGFQLMILDGVHVEEIVHSKARFRISVVELKASIAPYS